MNRIMKIFTGFITCVMISMLMSISVLAIDGFMISVGNAECSAGEMVVVPISMIDAPNFFVATIEIEYDENMMTLLTYKIRAW